MMGCLRRHFYLLILIASVGATGCDSSVQRVGQNEMNLVLRGLFAKAQKGDADAQCELGLCYYQGKNTNKDLVKAV